MDRAAESGGLWERLRGRHRVLVTNLLAVAAAAAALGGLAVVVNAVRVSRDQTVFPTFPGQDLPWLVFLDEALTFSLYPFEFSLVWVGLACALGVFALAGHASSAPLPLPWRRGVAAVALAAIVLPVLLSAFRVFVAVYAFSSTPQESENVYFAPREWSVVLPNLVRPGVAVVLGAALFIIGLAWWPGRPGEPGLLSDDDDELLDTALPTTDRYAPPTPRDRPAEADVPQPEPQPRLRPDGSSDSGYDEFRFRR